MDNVESEGSNIVRYPVPVLAGGQYAPVTLTAVELHPEDDGSAYLRFFIDREEGEQIRSFTLRYRFSSLSPAEEDTVHPYHEFRYDDPSINQKKQIVCKAHLPHGKEISGCTAYISRTEPEDGIEFAYEPSDFVFPESNVQKQKTKKARKTDAKPKKRIHPLSVIIPVFCALALAAGGVYLRYVGLERTAKLLIEQKRFNEAYRLSQDTVFEGIGQEVCRAACEYYLTNSDYTQAYVYAVSAPDPFGSIVAQKAADAAFTENGEIVSEFFAVAQKTGDPDAYDALMRRVADLYLIKDQYHVAMRASLAMKGEKARADATKQVFADAVRYYLRADRYEDAVAYMTAYASLVPDAGSVKDVLSQAGLSVGRADTVYLASLLGEDTSQIEIKPEDPAIRADLQNAYFLLTPEQMRAYHARSLAVGTTLYCVSDDGTLGDLKNVVSLSAHDHHTLVLYADGHVSSLFRGTFAADVELPEGSDFVAVASGGYHSVLLRADGTVTAVGDNSCGQCDVDSWQNIVAIAAGQYFTLGLQKDGTVVACGSDACGQCDVSEYHNVTDIAATNQAAVFLFSDGTVAVQGEDSMGLSDANRFSDVVSIRAGSTCIAAQKKDGSFAMASGITAGDFGSVIGWDDIADYDVGSVCIAARKTDGSVLTDGDNKPVR